MFDQGVEWREFLYQQRAHWRRNYRLAKRENLAEIWKRLLGRGKDFKDWGREWEESLKTRDPREYDLPLTVPWDYDEIEYEDDFDDPESPSPAPAPAPASSPSPIPSAAAASGPTPSTSSQPLATIPSDAEEEGPSSPPRRARSRSFSLLTNCDPDLLPLED